VMIWFHGGNFKQVSRSARHRFKAALVAAGA